MSRNLISEFRKLADMPKPAPVRRYFSTGSAKGPKVVVCGAAGGIGQPLSMLLKNSLPSGSTLSLYDVANVPGVAADLSHINTQVKVEAHLGDAKDANNTSARDAALKNADLVLIPAGVPRKPGMTRDDLFNVNAGIVKSLIEGVAKQCPKAWIAIITNPVNSTVPIAAEVLKKHNVYDPKKLFGVSTLDVVRAQTFIGDLKNIDSAKVQVDVIGGHSPETMIPVLSKVQGSTFTTEEAKTLTDKVKNAGTAVVEAKGGAGSATLSMAYAAYRFAVSAVKAIRGENVKEIAYVDTKSLKFDAPANYFGLTVDLGKEGITKVNPLPQLNGYEQEQLKVAVGKLNDNIATGEKFAKQ
eukprot:TRINITY_DN2005_c0_g1_i1.p2 TRINITY_DN2005_c0_g1~~TRINITY_DN2005_c0_g1_i1.p2  ORF type:complete len:389 (-),score=107.36 TRINITY_DN2005_c0_g1_i1:1257-2321(-)